MRIKLCLKHLETAPLGHNQEDACLMLTGGGSGAQFFRSDEEGEEASGAGEDSPPRATTALVLSRIVGQGVAGQEWRCHEHGARAGTGLALQHHFEDKEGTHIFS